jgi:hypothetical protein
MIPWLANLFKLRGNTDEMSDAPHPLFLLHVGSTQAAAADELGARVEHAPVVNDNGLELDKLHEWQMWIGKSAANLARRQLELNFH